MMLKFTKIVFYKDRKMIYMSLKDIELLEVSEHVFLPLFLMNQLID